MKAIVIEKFGGVEVLKLAQVNAPEAGPGEVLIRVSHAGVNPVDWKIREGYLKDLFPHRFPVILGWDAAGTIEAVGEGVEEFRRGERVYAYTRKAEVAGGSYAEYIVVPASAVARVPKKLADAEAAALPLAA